MTELETLAAHLAQLDLASLPAAVRDAARLRAVDAVAARAAGLGSDLDAILQAMAPRLGSDHAAAPAPANAEWNALVGAALAHRHESDDIDDATLLCIGGLIVPAALALGGARGASGAATLTAIVAGYEAMGRLGQALGSARLLARGWWPTAVCGPAGVAAAAGRLRGLDARALAHALALAVQHSGGLAGGEDGILGRNLLYGSVARAGLLAAAAAHAGAAGPRDILVGARGLGAAYAVELNPAALVADLGEQYVVARTALKPYACARQLHAAVEAALALRADRDPATVERTIVALPAESAFADRPPGEALPATPAGSAQWVLAATLVRGSMLPADLTPAALGDPRVRSLAPRVAVEIAPPGARAPLSATLTLHTAGGATRRAVSVPRGGPARPLSEADVLAKAHALAEPSLGAAAAPLLALAQRLETLPSVAPLADPRGIPE